MIYACDFILSHFAFLPLPSVVRRALAPHAPLDQQFKCLAHIFTHWPGLKQLIIGSDANADTVRIATRCELESKLQ